MRRKNSVASYSTPSSASSRTSFSNAMSMSFRRNGRSRGATADARQQASRVAIPFAVGIAAAGLAGLRGVPGGQGRDRNRQRTPSGAASDSSARRGKRGQGNPAPDADLPDAGAQSDIS